jgi:hypothetical protein
MSLSGIIIVLVVQVVIQDTWKFIFFVISSSSNIVKLLSAKLVLNALTHQEAVNGVKPLRSVVDTTPQVHPQVFICIVTLAIRNQVELSFVKESGIEKLSYPLISFLASVSLAYIHHGKLIIIGLYVQLLFATAQNTKLKNLLFHINVPVLSDVISYKLVIDLYGVTLSFITKALSQVLVSNAVTVCLCI